MSKYQTQSNQTGRRPGYLAIAISTILILLVVGLLWPVDLRLSYPCARCVKFAHRWDGKHETDLTQALGQPSRIWPTDLELKENPDSGTWTDGKHLKTWGYEKQNWSFDIDLADGRIHRASSNDHEHATGPLGGNCDI